jgi:hypothetical protein
MKLQKDSLQAAADVNFCQQLLMHARTGSGTELV